MNQTINLSAFWKITDSADQPTDDIEKACWLYVGPSPDARIVTIGREQHEKCNSAVSLAMDAYFYGSYAPEARLSEQFVLHSSANPLYTEGRAGYVGPKWLAKHGMPNAWWHEFGIAMDDGRSLYDRIVIGAEIDPAPDVDAAIAEATAAGAQSHEIAALRAKLWERRDHATSLDRKFFWARLVEEKQTFKVWMAHNRAYFAKFIEQLQAESLKDASSIRNEAVTGSSARKQFRAVTWQEGGRKPAVVETDNPEGESEDVVYTGTLAVYAKELKRDTFELMEVVNRRGTGNIVDLMTVDLPCKVRVYMVEKDGSTRVMNGETPQPLSAEMLQSYANLPSYTAKFGGFVKPRYGVEIVK